MGIDDALQLVSIAAKIAPALRDAIDAWTKDDPSPIAAQVRYALPEVSESEVAAEQIRQLAAEGGG